MLKRNGRADDAADLLDRAIALFPEQLLLRLERAFISEQFDDLDKAELDFRFVLERDPDNVIALNALGYTLANKTSRHHEALDLIKRALALQPGDAAIIDSLGWAHFRLGNINDAIRYLELAFDKFPDDEIAAHLIEAYWTHGQTGKARSLIKSFKQENDATPRVDEAILRLGI